MVQKNPTSKRARPSSSQKPAKSTSSKADAGTQPVQDVARQQKVLDVFTHTFRDVLLSDNLTATLQEVKQALFNRDFDKAFGSEEYLEVYAARWSPTRALCYAAVLAGIRGHLEGICTKVEDGRLRRFKSLLIGGGAAEVVAVSDCLSQTPDMQADITLLDSAPWEGVIKKLHAGLTTAPPLSKYASEATRAANAALVPSANLTSIFTQQDILAVSKDKISELVGSGPLLITLLFTLNELFTSGGIGKTSTFLLNLTAAAPPDSLLLVVDSPGSYSEAAVGKESKRYPMQWLLDKVLLGPEAWTKVESHDSLWFRLSQSLSYPIPLEDMRYQMHLYRVTKPSD